MRIIQRYLRKVVISAILLVSLTLLGIESFMEFINELPDIGKDNYGILLATRYVLMQLPSDFYQLFPIAGFLGGLLGIGRLANNSELIVMRASGISVLRITWIVAKTAILLLLVVAAIGEWWAPKLQYQATVMKLKAMHKQPEVDQAELWIRHNNGFLHVERVVTSEKINGIISFRFDANNQMTSISSAPEAVYHHQGQWHMHDVTLTQLNKTQVVTTHAADSLLNFNFKPMLLKQLNRDTNEENLLELWENIQSHKQAGLISTHFEFDFWQRILQPFTILIMVCLGVPFIFGSLRTASTSARVLIGITIGFGFYMTNRFIGPLTLVYQWPPWVVAALPPLLFMTLCIYLLYRAR